MLRLNRRSRPQTNDVEFCDSCSQVCTPACRAQAQRDRAQAMVGRWIAPR